jgi:hypothetical protein
MNGEYGIANSEIRMIRSQRPSLPAFAVAIDFTKMAINWSDSSSKSVNRGFGSNSA